MKPVKPVAHSFDTDLGLPYDQLTQYLGGKGANLNIMKRELGVPVPPGFTIPTPFCPKYMKKHKYTPVMEREVDARLTEMESVLGRGLGDPDRPMLVSVRSGAPISMPGMMDTILNLGLNETTLRGLTKQTSELFALDCYRRFLQMFGSIVRGFPNDYYTGRYNAYTKLFSLVDYNYKKKGLRNLVRDYQNVEEIPHDPRQQLQEATISVFKSWMSPRAIAYRNHYGIDSTLGTAVTVQAMVFGNLNDNSGSGVLFSRNPNTGRKEHYCNYLVNAQGEDVVAGTANPGTIQDLKREQPACYKELIDCVERTLEPHFRDMVDVEFTIEDGKLYILQVRAGKRTPDAARQIALDLLHEDIITKRECDERWAKIPQNKPAPKVKKMKKQVVVAQGEPSSPGTVWGPAMITPSNPLNLKGYILVRRFTETDDFEIMTPAAGIATAEGGVSSHAAVVARELGRPCVVGAGFSINKNEAIMPDGTVVNEGQIIGINGSTGEIFMEGQNGSAQKK